MHDQSRRTLAPAVSRLRKQAEHVWADRTLRWASFALAATLWLAVALTDARLLVVAVLVGAATAVVYRRRGEAPGGADEHEDWF
jgi:hypothetical protein